MSSNLRLVFNRLRVLDQHAARRLGMQEANHPGEALARFLIDEWDSLRARGFEIRVDAVALEAYVMQAAAASREEFSDAAVGIERLEQFDLASTRIEQRRLHTLVGDRSALDEPQAQRVAPELQALLKIRHHDADVMDSLQHRASWRPGD